MSLKSDLFRSVRRVFTGKRAQEASKEEQFSFNARREKEEAYEAVERGTLMVPLDRIVGSVGRYHDFDNQFKTKTHSKSPRLKGILTAMQRGKQMPPIALYQIKDDYFIVDGHHRFKAAAELEQSHIRSKIIELLPSKDTLENKLYKEKIAFRDKTQLEHCLELTEPGQFAHLEWQIAEHQSALKKSRGEQISFEQAAADWYTTIYQPLYTLIENSNLVNSFPQRTIDDLFLYISVHQWEKGKKRTYGLGIDRLIPTDMEAFRKKMAARNQQDYPEMKREITVFILLNIEGRYEEEVIDRLLGLDEVREVHSVHGSFDVITKVVLSRDLLSSDAELISHFTQYTIRQWEGIISSQTLIPGLSKVKEE
ncbi:MAG: transcriptional regulator [Deltaproteobacteria bacterium]|nr:MAG: transcriptional regulator [Desulfobacterales bacterium]PIE72196.1 MAG: transcriptional regulator [Deltaproteobacteria bacterium]